MAVVRLVDLRGLLHRLGSESDLVAADPVAGGDLESGHLALDGVGVLDGDIGKSLRQLQCRFALLFGVEQDLGGFAAVGLGKHGLWFLRLDGQVLDQKSVGLKAAIGVLATCQSCVIVTTAGIVSVTMPILQRFCVLRARPVSATAKPGLLNDWYHSKQSQTANSLPRDTHCAAIPVIAQEETS